MKKFSVLLMSLVVVLGFASCGSNGGDETPADTTVPVITLEEPHGQEVMDGADFSLQGTVTDDVNLKEWSYSIVKTGELPTKKNTEVWTVSETIPATGTSQVINKTITVKSKAFQGIYTITVKAKDAAGHEALEQTKTINVIPNTSK